MPRKRKGTNFTRKKKGAKTRKRDDTATNVEPSVPVVQPSLSEGGVIDEELVRQSIVKVVRGSRSQNDSRYSEDSRNLQGAANAIVALAYNNLIPFSTWNTQIIDNILDYGDVLYKESISSIFSQISGTPLDFLGNGVSTNFIIDDVYYSLDIKEMDTVIGQVGDWSEMRGELGVSVVEGFRRVFTSYQAAIFTCELMSVCVGSAENTHYLFESRSCGSDGRSTEVDGKACLLRFGGMQSLLDFMMKNFDRPMLYTLVPIKVRIGFCGELLDAYRYHVLKFKEAASSDRDSWVSKQVSEENECDDMETSLRRQWSYLRCNI